MNLRTALNRAKFELNNFDSGELDAKILLLKAIEQDEKYLILNPLFFLTNSQHARFRRYIRRRKKGEPVAYITGHKEFYGLDFKINKNVLIPRPETEMLVENALHFLESRIKNKELRSNNRINIIDVGTGSGCIITAVMKEIQKIIIHNSSFTIRAFAVDISNKALSVAKFNVKKHEVDEGIKFYNSDLFSNQRLPKKYDLIIANLPYLKPDYKNLDFEPRSALDGGPDGLSIVRKLIEQLPEKLVNEGIALLEIDNDQFSKLKKIVNKHRELSIEEITEIPHWHGTVKITRE